MLRLIGPRALAYLALGVFGLFTVFPFVWMFLSSLKPLDEIFTSSSWLPQSPTLDNYARLISEYNAPRAIWNSLWIATATTTLRVFFCSLGGYAFAKFSFPGRSALIGLMLATMAVPFVVTFVPLFVFMRNTFNWINTPWPIIVPWAANAFGIFLMRQFLLGFPDEIIDAARVDGASEFGIFLRIVLPASVPAVASLAFLSFVGNWNSYMWPSAVLQVPQLETLPLLLTHVQQNREQIVIPYDLLMAGAVVSTVPMLLMLGLVWRRFGKDVVAGAVKG